MFAFSKKPDSNAVRNSENGKLNAKELVDISIRVRKIRSLLAKSSDLWLEIAAEFAEAHAKLKSHAFQRFINDAGFTISVASKLVVVGKCKHLYSEDAKEFISFVDGWSTLYEVSKLTDEKVSQLWNEMRAQPNLRLSRSLVKNVANGAQVGSKDILLFTVFVEDSAIGAITEVQRNLLEAKLKEAQSLLDTMPKIFKYKDSFKKLDTVACAKPHVPTVVSERHELDQAA